MRVDYRHVASAPTVSIRPIYLCDGEIVAVQDEVGRERFCPLGELAHPHAEKARLSVDGVGLPARSLARHYSSTVSPHHFDHAEVGEDQLDDCYQRLAARGRGRAADLGEQVCNAIP